MYVVIEREARDFQSCHSLRYARRCQRHSNANSLVSLHLSNLTHSISRIVLNSNKTTRIFEKQHSNTNARKQVHIDTTKTDTPRSANASRDGAIPRVPPRCVRTTVRIPSLVRARTISKSTDRTASVSTDIKEKLAINTRVAEISDEIATKTRTASRRHSAFKRRTRVRSWISLLESVDVSLDGQELDVIKPCVRTTARVRRTESAVWTSPAERRNVCVRIIMSVSTVREVSSAIWIAVITEFVTNPRVHVDATPVGSATVARNSPSARV